MSLAATATTDPILQARAGQERRWISEVSRLSGRPPAILGWSSRPLVGAESLAGLTAPAA
jgi:arsenite-transporting ATPase